MALGRQGERQADLMIGWAELPRSPGHVFHDRLQTILVGAGFDRFAEKECAPYYADKRGRPSLPPGRYFRMHLVGYFEGIDVNVVCGAPCGLAVITPCRASGGSSRWRCGTATSSTWSSPPTSA